MSISSLVLELWQSSFIRDWPEIWELEIPPSGFCQISGDWGKLWIPNLARISLIKYYWMLRNSRVTALTILELLKKNQLEGWGVKLLPHPTRLGLNMIMETILINTESSKMIKPHNFVLNWSQRLDLKNSNKQIALQNLSIYYPWKNIKKHF